MNMNKIESQAWRLYMATVWRRCGNPEEAERIEAEVKAEIEAERDFLDRQAGIVRG